MIDKEGIRARARKMLWLQKIERSIVESGEEGISIQIPRCEMPTMDEIDKVCDRYERTWGESLATAGKDTADLIIDSGCNSGDRKMIAWAYKEVYGKPQPRDTWRRAK